MFYARKLETPETMGAISGSKVEEPERRGIPYINDLQTFREEGSFIPGGQVSDPRPLGTLDCQVFAGDAALAGMELARLDRERLTALPPRGSGSLDTRLRKLGINPRRR